MTGSSRLLSDVYPLKLPDTKRMPNVNPVECYQILVSLLSKSMWSIASTMLSTGRGASTACRREAVANLTDMEGIEDAVDVYLASTSATSL